MTRPRKDKLAPENDRRTKEYRQRMADAGSLDIPPHVEAAAVAIYDAGFRGTPDRSWWVPTSDIIGAVQIAFPNLTALTGREWAYALWCAEPDVVRVRRRLNGRGVYGYAGLKGPNGVRTPVMED